MGGKATTITNAVKALRKEAGLSQQALADAVGATRQTILTIEAERYGPSLELAFRIAHVLEKRVDEVFIFAPDWT
ncbi:helix-turn-helix transcriptional regulator [uncultured Algimonas sp.]|uniref:helix-turn-helix transcriptional regulator n=1 Tax=uncultured Algimonas sp. TaxID=1547920 RepID=UPI0026082822|nr:helix-turn-helix transcriptional regulator [uncultured Algimonas sp.]